MEQEKKQESKIFFLWILLFLCLSGAVFLLGRTLNSERSSTVSGHPVISATSVKANELVNKNLYLTDRQIEIQQQKMNEQNNFSPPSVGENIIRKSNQWDPNYGVDHSSDSAESRVASDLGRDRKAIGPMGPDNDIRSQLADQEQSQKYEVKYKAEYARQFVENAARNGYEVFLDDNFVVINVKKIREPTSHSILAPPVK